MHKLGLFQNINRFLSVMVWLVSRRSSSLWSPPKPASSGPVSPSTPPSSDCPGRPIPVPMCRRVANPGWQVVVVVGVVHSVGVVAVSAPVTEALRRSGRHQSRQNHTHNQRPLPTQHLQVMSPKLPTDDESIDWCNCAIRFFFQSERCQILSRPNLFVESASAIMWANACFKLSIAKMIHFFSEFLEDKAF